MVFNFRANTIKINYNQTFPIVVTVIDYNGDAESLSQIGRTSDDVEDMRNILFSLSKIDGCVCFDSRGWNRIDTWHIGDYSDPHGVYSKVQLLGREEGVLLNTNYIPGDYTNDGILNFFDMQKFIEYYNENSGLADLALPIGVVNIFDVQKFISYFNDR